MTQVPDYGKSPTSKRRQVAKRWLIRLGVVAACLSIAIPTSLFVWSWWENRQLEAELASLRAAGEPSVLSDLDSPPIPAAENCVSELRAAAAVIDKHANAFKKIDDLNGWRLSVGLPLRADEHAVIRAALDASAEAFPLVDSAVAKPGIGLDLKFTSPALNMLYPDLNQQRALANALSRAAFDAQARGDTAAALRHVEHMLRIGHVVDHIPNILGHLVSIGIDAIAANTVQQVASDAARGNTPMSPQAREEAERLVKQFLDDAESDAGLRRALVGERTSGVDIARSIAAGKLSAAGTPVNRGPRAYMLRNGRGIKWFYDDVLMALSGARDVKAYRTAYAKQPRVTERNPRLYLLVRILAPSIDRAVAQHFAGRATRHLAATALAITLYRADHDGAFPTKLDELVPKYLPAVPADPLATADSRVRYIADEGRPRLYSVGEDGADDGGVPRDPDAALDGVLNLKPRAADIVIDLLPQPRPLPETRESEEP
jgi:hypothetical protein